MIKKIISVLISLLMMLGVCTFNVTADFAFEDEVAELIGTRESNKEIISQYVNYDWYKNAVYEKVLAFEEKISVSEYGITTDSGFVHATFELVKYEMPYLFHVKSLSYGYNSKGYVTYLKFNYNRTKEEYDVQRAELSEKVQSLTKDVKNNANLTKVEQALILHDRLAIACEYDYTYTKRDAYEALISGSGVCEGYTLAYGLLLDEVGIENEVCSSEKLNHAWNIVYIDGKPYHVDVTWDDPSWASKERGVEGFVKHENFLRSTNGIVSTDHTATDYISTPTDTTYDSYFWQNSNAAFILLENEIYYIDSENDALKRYSDQKELCSVEGVWKASGNRYWVGNFGRLATDKKDLYFSTADKIYRYDVNKGAAEVIFAPQLDGIDSIYGLSYADGLLVCDVNNAPPFGGGTTLRQIVIALESEVPTLVLKPESNYIISDNVLNDVTEKTSVAVVKDNFEYQVVIKNQLGDEVDNESAVGTGFIVSLPDGSESVTVVVKGDVDGDGLLSATDYLKIKSFFLGMIPLEGIYFEAADVDASGQIDSTDYLNLKSHFLGIVDIYK